ncbi:MAG: PGAP1-like family protein [Symbiobacteriaceae bacterium]|jgi:pimeloyl-ACP methyl ester carboxylesterase|nr:PGAP1-like family protein [Symbiobacteriaceae bacterium]
MIPRWVSERMDDYVFDLIKLVYRGYRDRIPAYRPPGDCEPPPLEQIEPPAAVDLTPAPGWKGFDVQDLRFPSPLECGCDENRHTHGRLLTTAPGAPWALIVPGYSTGALPPGGYGIFQDTQALALLRRGINVALVTLPYHMQRRRPGCGSGEGFFSPDLADMVTTFRQAAADCIALFRWLQAQSDLPVGVWGTSLGGNVAGMMAAHVDEIAALVLMEPLDNPGDALRLHRGSREIRQALENAGVSPEVLTEALAAVAPSNYQPKVPLERIIFISPLWDGVIPYRFQNAFWEAWGRPERISTAAGHLTMPLDSSINARVADFMAARLLQ